MVTGVCLRKTTDFSQTRGRAGLPTRRPSNADKTLRSPTQLAMARGTTKPDSKKHVVVSVQVRKSGDIWPFCVQAQAAEDVLEWLQPSGRRPEGCCCLNLGECTHFFVQQLVVTDGVSPCRGPGGLDSTFDCAPDGTLLTFTLYR